MTKNKESQKTEDTYVNHDIQDDHYVDSTLSHQGVFIPASDEAMLCMMRFPSEKSENLFLNPTTDFAFFLDNSNAETKLNVLQLM